MVTSLEGLVGHSIRVWQIADQANLREVLPRGGAPEPRVEFRDGELRALDDDRRVGPIPGMPGYWFEVEDVDDTVAKRDYGELIGGLLSAEMDAIDMAGELADRYEEIDLLYTIAETIGRTVSLKEACRSILREVCAVVNARRGSILVCDAEETILNPVASLGFDVTRFDGIPLDDPVSIAARAFRERRTVSLDPTDPRAEPPIRDEVRPYLGDAFLSVPVLYPRPDGPPRPVGVINLTDREGLDAFSTGHVKLVTAIANQIGATIENARLVVLERQRERLDHELGLARDLQRKLLPTFHRSNGCEMAARCEPIESVGGDFYKVFDLREGKVGVMLGDVSSHGFAAALMMALVLSAAGIHAAEGESPARALAKLADSLGGEMEKAEMHFSVFYGVVDPTRGILSYANAGHPHVFMLREGGDPVRLGASAPPLGLGGELLPRGEEVEWVGGKDVLLLFSDGVSDALTGAGERFGEEAVVETVKASLSQSAAQIVENVYAALETFGGPAPDDQTVVVLKA